MKKISILVFSVILITFIFTGCQNSSQGPEAMSQDGSFGSGFIGSGFVGSGNDGFMGSGFVDGEILEVPEIEKYPVIGTKTDDKTLKKTTLMNLSGKDIIGFSIKSSTEGAFGNNMLANGETFLLDEIRTIYYTPQAGAAAPFDLQLTMADWTVYVLHDIPFEDMELGRICLQNEIPFLEYTSEETGEEVITRGQETDILAAQWQAYQDQLAMQQQQYTQQVYPQTSNDAGCVGNQGLVY